MKEHSAGILVYRFSPKGELEVLLGKCGGPRWEKRFVGAWNIPKGHVEDHETDLEAAAREFREETSLDLDINEESLIDLGESNTSSGKKSVKIYAIEKDFNPDGGKVEIESNMCETEWPPKSGQMIEVPELSQCMYFKASAAKKICFSYQKIFIERLEEQLSRK